MAMPGIYVHAGAAAAATAAAATDVASAADAAAAFFCKAKIKTLKSKPRNLKPKT